MNSPKKIPSDFPFKIRTSGAMTLILLKASAKSGHEVFFENTSRLQKDDLVKKFDPESGDILLMAWTGNHSTDIFNVTKKDLEKFYQ